MARHLEKNADDKHLTTGQVLDALIAHGWIDGVRRKLDDDRVMQLISPRRTQYWAKTYKDRAERLEVEGRMRPPGRASVEAGKASGLWSYMDDVDALITPEDLDEALTGAAAAFFHGAAPSYRRNILRWIKLAKTAPTRAKRITEVVARSRAGEKVPQM